MARKGSKKGLIVTVALAVLIPAAGLAFVYFQSNTTNCASAENLKSCYEGLTEERATKRAKENRLQVRIISRDGIGLPNTADLKTSGRINFMISDGVVTSAQLF